MRRYRWFKHYGRVVDNIKKISVNPVTYMTMTVHNPRKMTIPKRVTVPNCHRHIVFTYLRFHNIILGKNNYFITVGLPHLEQSDA